MFSWKAAPQPNTEPTEHLFVSSKALFDGSRPVRGGIPVVFPCFGPPTHPEHSKLSQHGFARREIWNWDSVVMDNEAGVSVRLSASPSRINTVILSYERTFSSGAYSQYHRDL